MFCVCGHLIMHNYKAFRLTLLIDYFPNEMRNNVVHKIKRYRPASAIKTALNDTCFERHNTYTALLYMSYGSFTLHETGTRNDGLLYYAMYCTHSTGTGAETGNHCFLLCQSRSLSLSRSRAVCISHYLVIRTVS